MALFGDFRPIKKPEPDPPEEPEEFDLDKETGWRLDRFDELGFDLFTSLKLAVAKADWQRAKKMLDKGASHAQVEQILT